MYTRLFGWKKSNKKESVAIDEGWEKITIPEENSLDKITIPEENSLDKDWETLGQAEVIPNNHHLELVTTNNHRELITTGLDTAENFGAFLSTWIELNAITLKLDFAKILESSEIENFSSQRQATMLDFDMSFWVVMNISGVLDMITRINRLNTTPPEIKLPTIEHSSELFDIHMLIDSISAIPSYAGRHDRMFKDCSTLGNCPDFYPNDNSEVLAARLRK